MNSRNFGLATGRLTRDPVVFTNKDGSRKIMFTVAAQNDYKNKDKSRGAQFVSIEAFVPASSANNGVYDYMHKTDLVTAEYTVHSDSYEKNGETVYSTVLFCQNVTLLESKTTADARHGKAGEAAPEAAPDAVPAPAPEGDGGVADEPAFGK